MKCEEAAEFVSALIDGERIPREAAEHVGQCETCGSRLKEYAGMGAGLRCAASLESVEEPRVRRWEQKRGIASHWWWKGWETMRIPRFAFVLLLVAVFVLASSLAIGRVRAHTRGRLVMLTAKPAEGHTVLCTMYSGEKDGICNEVQTEGTEGGEGVYKFRMIADDGERIQLGILAARVYHHVSKDEFANMPVTVYSFKPGETLHIDVPQAGDLAINGEVWDHYPSPGELWDHMQSLANCR
jgi:hypothetical protein